MVDAHLPEIYTGTAFNAEPFDPAAVPIWVDLSSRYLGTGSATRGRSQYELGQGQTGQADVSWYDQDEALNTTNASSPYSPGVVPYRPFLWRLMWPNGGTGNLLGGAGYDGSFESYTLTSQIAWLVALANLAGAGTTVVTLVSAGAWQGTRAANLAVSTSPTAIGGAQFTMPTIPGRTYTAQAHINQNVARAFQLAVGNQTIAVDPFTRTTANGWGTPPAVFGFGPTWTTSGGTLANYLTAGGLAVHSQSSVNTRMATLTGAGVQDCDVWVTVTIPVVATGQAIQASLYARWLSANDSVSCLISFSTSNQVTITAQRTTGGSTFSIGSNATIDTYVAGDSFRMHLKSVGPDIWCKGWKVTNPTPEPAAWSVQVSDSTTSVPGKVGVTSILTTGNTNTLPVALSFSDFRAIGSIVDTVNGVTSTSGSYQLLKQTFVATQPLHTITLETQAVPPGAATVLVDGIQLEPGGTANTFTTAGPIIRSPWTRGYVERWPIAWDDESQGFLGIMSGPVVGPWFQLAKAELHTELAGAILAKTPQYYWRLNETGDGTTTFGESSGNGGPSLRKRDFAGGTPTFTVGAQTDIPGNPGQGGVTMDGAVPTSEAGSSLQVGPVAGDPQLAGLGTSQAGGSAATWGFTVCAWAVNISAPTGFPGAYYGSYAFITGPTHAGDLTPPYVALGLGDGFGNGGGISINFHDQLLSVHDSNPPKFDGQPHFYCGVWQMTSTTYSLTMYIDGTQIATTSGNPATVWTLPIDTRMTWAELFGTIDGNPGITNPNANFTMSDVGVWNRALSAAEVTDIWNAGQGYVNENSGTRVARHLALAGYTGTADIGQGLTFMGVSPVTEGTKALDAILSTQDTEFGMFAESQEGVMFRGRQARYLAVTPSYVFGERIDLGEYPYLGDIKYDHDATYVYNQAIITRTGGIVATAVDATGQSQIRYGVSPFTRTVGGNSDNEAQDAANWVVANGKDARPRLAALTFDLAATRGVTGSIDGTMWYMALSLEVGMRVTANRRPKAANGGAGLTMSSDFFIESISPGAVDPETGTFTMALLLSPVPVTAQPWILEDATYGVLNSTTVLGF